MSAGTTEIQALYLISLETRQKIDDCLLKFPPEQKQSALLSALKWVQADNQGWLSRAALNAVSQYLGVPKIAVYEAATFYSQFELKPVGEHVLSICTNVSCVLNDVEGILAHFQKRLGIGLGETTPDGRITLKPVECLAACQEAPMLQYREQNYACLTPEKVDRLLAELS
jgi:NADH-quinone oxidoreductase subunit E